ncbi:GntR family transcriptional regulator [Bartonella sp. HY038]|uniref:GntR family transcriptional regulator n=1 Tax=Bartonella sp. HY038 TaxID=2759660 RepID=UPI0015FD791F|nr:GntR family transcriptional regulator [Bartonella sp. HY038]
MKKKPGLNLLQDEKHSDETIKQWVYRSLRLSIMTGHFPPAQPVTVKAISDLLDVSATPIREALHRLVAEGALENLDNRRVRIPDIDPNKFDEIIAARIALETLAAERALPFVDFMDLARLRSIDQEINHAYETGNIQLGIEKNFAFHRYLYQKRSAAVLLPLIESVWLRLGPFMREATENLSESYTVDHHQEALAALEKKDSPALKAAIIADIDDGAGYLGRKRFIEAEEVKRSVKS